MRRLFSVLPPEFKESAPSWAAMPVPSGRTGPMPGIHRSSVLVRVVLGLLGATLGLQAALHLKKGEPDYFNFFRQPVSAHVALVLGIAAMVMAVAPWPRTSDRQRSPRARRDLNVDPHRFQPPAGRNDPCPCGSGVKYKRCCLPRDEERRRAEALDRRSAQLNRQKDVTSTTDMVDRGLKGP